MSHTLLVADNDPTVVQVLQKELEALGYVVHTATNGQTAQTLARRYHVDLIIMDVAMPIMSGIKALETLRSHPETQQTPVIFLTGLPSATVYPTV